MTLGHIRERSAPVTNVMSVDVEEHFHVSAFERTVPRSAWGTIESRVCRNTHRLLDLFDEFHVKGTFFVLGMVAQQFPALVREIATRGHEIASHGYAHRLIYTQTRDAFRQDVRLAKELIEQTSGSSVKGYRAPSFSVTAQSLWALDILLEEGHSYDASVFPIRHDRYGIPDAPRHPYRLRREGGTLVELPGSIASIAGINVPVAGGGYFRILPYAWTRWGIGRLNRRDGQPAIFYLHPWEIDPEQPRLPASRLSRFRHYRNLHKTEGRLRALLSAFHFDTVASLLARDSAGPPVVAAAMQ